MEETTQISPELSSEKSTVRYADELDLPMHDEIILRTEEYRF